MSEGGNIIRFIARKSEWISEELMHIVATNGDLVFSSPNKVIKDGETDGETIGSYDFKEQEEKITNCAIYFWRCEDYMDLSRKEKRGEVEPDKSKIYGFDWMKKITKTSMVTIGTVKALMIREMHYQ